MLHILLTLKVYPPNLSLQLDSIVFNNGSFSLRTSGDVLKNLTVVSLGPIPNTSRILLKSSSFSLFFGLYFD